MKITLTVLVLLLLISVSAWAGTPIPYVTNSHFNIYSAARAAEHSALGTAAQKNIPATGNASATEVVYGTDTRLTDSRNAADVSAWAKAATKPSYTYTEVGADAAGAAAAITLSKIGTFTKSTGDSTGSDSYTGVGFKPTSVLFIAIVSNTDRLSIGIDNAVIAGALANANKISAGTWETDPSSIVILQSAGYGAYYTGKISSLDTDGFTISWTKNGAITETITVYYLAFK